MKDKTEIRIREHIVHIVIGDEFLTFTRRPDDEHNLQHITLSFPPTAKFADTLESSGIIEVQSFNENGTMLFSRKPFYETSVFIDVLIDAVNKYIYTTHPM